MADIVFGTEKHLQFRTDTWTLRELEAYMACRSKAINSFHIGALLGAGITWMSSRRLRTLPRISLSGGAALLFGLWRLHGSLYQAADNLLSLDGSAVQKQLAHLIVDKFSDNLWLMQLVSKHFIFEKVYADSASDKPIIRWRYRNFFEGEVAYGQQLQDSRSLTESDREKTDLGFKQVPVTVSPTIDALVDPLDCILGYSDQEDVICHHPNTSTASSATPRIVTRRQKRLQRRRMRHDKAALDHKHELNPEGEYQLA